MSSRPTPDELRRSATSRRDFLTRSGTAVSGLWLTRLTPLATLVQACTPEASEVATFTTFSPREGADFEAFAARIVPSDDTPGAREAGSVYFADRALQNVLSDVLPIIQGGLGSLAERVVALHGEDAVFSELGEAEQDAIVAAVEQEDPGFFFFGRVLVTVGLICNPAYGGNRDQVGWELIGFQPTYAYQPPFGYYDRDEHGGAA